MTGPGTLVSNKRKISVKKYTNSNRQYSPRVDLPSMLNLLRQTISVVVIKELIKPIKKRCLGAFFFEDTCSSGKGGGWNSGLKVVAEVFGRSETGL